jgi:hypothetical protein
MRVCVRESITKILCKETYDVILIAEDEIVGDHCFVVPEWEDNDTVFQ